MIITGPFDLPDPDTRRALDWLRRLGPDEVRRRLDARRRPVANEDKHREQRSRSVAPVRRTEPVHPADALLGWLGVQP